MMFVMRVRRRILPSADLGCAGPLALGKEEGASPPEHLSPSRLLIWDVGFLLIITKGTLALTHGVL